MRNTIKINHGSCKMIAHRGASALERENTLAAFVAAGNRSYYGIETDIHPTLDGELAVIHDDHTARVSFSSVNVEQCRYSDLRALRLKDLDGNERSDLCIPKLEEYLRIAHSYGKHCFLELKGSFEQESIQRAVNAVGAEYNLDNVTFISFDLDSLITLREMLPTQSIQYLTTELSESLLRTLAEHRIGVDALHTALTPEWIDRIHSMGLEINCWTVDDPHDAERLIEMGVDYITSNRLE